MEDEDEAEADEEVPTPYGPSWTFWSVNHVKYRARRERRERTPRAGSPWTEESEAEESDSSKSTSGANKEGVTCPLLSVSDFDSDTPPFYGRRRDS